ncbi:MAG: hypothetical protein OXC14_13620 [Rhodospirillaceae bacterium]|nr:hypothetical protein [Rhodospirillaceae bacterium]
MLLGKSHAELVVHGLSPDTMDTIESGLSRWGVHWRIAERPSLGSAVRTSKGTVPVQDDGRRIVSESTPLCEIRQAVRLVLVRRQDLSRTASCVLAYFGLEDGEKQTLQSLADNATRYGFDRPVTRERVRQVVQNAVRYIGTESRRIHLQTWSETVEDLKTRTPLAPSDFAAAFGFKPGGDPVPQVAALGKWADRLSMDWPFAVLESPVLGSLVVTKQAEEKWGETLREIPREAGGSYVSVRRAAQALDCETKVLIKMLERSPKWGRLDKEGLYYWKRPKLPPRDLAKTRNPLLTTLLRVFSVTGRAWSAELVLAIARARIMRKGEDGIPDLPVEVLEGIAEQSGLFVARDGEIIRTQAQSWNTLNEHDEMLLRVYGEHGRTISSHVLHGGLIRAGLSQDVARVTVAYSPFCIHTASGVGYKEGRYKSIARISEILAFVGAADRLDDKGTQGDEPQEIRIAVDARLRMTGECVLQEASGLFGLWEVRDTSGKRIADLSLLNGRLVGMSPVLRALGAGRRDVLCLRRRNGGFTASVEHLGA